MNSGRSSGVDAASARGKLVIDLDWARKAPLSRETRYQRVGLLQRVQAGLLAVCMLAAVAPASAAGPLFGFSTPVRYQVRSYAEALAIGDVSGDARDDVVVFIGNATSDRPSYLFVYVQANGGALATPYQIQLNASAFVNPSVGIADFNHDGSNDIVIGLGHGLLVLVADGQGGFSQSQFIDNHPSTVEKIADINGDGSPDVLSSGVRENSVVFGNGKGFFEGRTVLPREGDYSRVTYGDVTGDGHGDIVATGAYDLLVANGDGQGNFSTWTHYPDSLQVNNGSVAIGNFFGDDRNEVAVAKQPFIDEPGLYVYQQDVSGALQAPLMLKGGGPAVASIARDLDGDGREDLLVAKNGSVSVYLHEPGGLVDTPTSYQVNFQWAWAGFASGDLNDDGCPDVALADYDLVSVMYGACDDGKTTPSDFDGDDVADLLWRNTATGAGSIWKSANYGTQQSLDHIPYLDWQIVATGDFDGDAMADIVWHNLITGEGMIWKSGRSLPQQSLTRITDLNWKIVAAGDFNGDDRDDLLWRHAVNGKNAIWKSGNFATQQTITAVTDVRWKVVGSGDFDGDGRSDILWRHATTGGNAIWKGGNYRNQQPVTAITNIDWKVGAIGDFDGDGSDDVFWRHVNGSNTIWRSAVYAQQVAVPKQPTRWILAAAADYDGNGRDDIAWRNTVDGSNVIWGSADAANMRSLTTVPDQNWRIH